MGVSQATHRDTRPHEHKDFAEDPALERAVHEAGTLLFKDTTLKEILAGKKQASIPKLVTVSADQTVYEAIKQMDHFRIGAVLVQDEKGEVVGVFTERDYLKKLALKGLWSRETKIRNVMTTPVQWGTTKDLATHWMGRMTHERFRHVPVRDAETKQVMGVVSIGDLMKAVLVTTVDTAGFLRDLIEGRYSK
jgi:CBS domain-containing protein